MNGTFKVKKNQRISIKTKRLSPERKPPRTLLSLTASIDYQSMFLIRVIFIENL